MSSSLPSPSSLDERHFTWLLWALVGLLLGDADTVQISALISRVEPHLLLGHRGGGDLDCDSQYSGIVVNGRWKHSLGSGF